MIRSLLVTLLLFLYLIDANAQVYKTEALVDDVHTIQVNANGNWQQLPIITLNSPNYIRVNFDRLGNKASANLRYKIVHCNADWTESSLSDIDFLSGFNNPFIDDYAESINTTVDYTNFNIEIPNDRQKLKLSGNYAVSVYEDGKLSEPILTACFSVLEPIIEVSANVSPKTNIDANKSHQQVNIEVDCSNIQLRDPFTDLKITVQQNNRQDNQATNIKPTYIRGNKLAYEQNNSLIFEAGNVYRRFESVSYRYNGLNIQTTEYNRPYYYTYLRTAQIRADKRYVHDLDQNGRFFIRNAETPNGDSDTEADYFVTEFILSAPDPFLEPIYINGYLTNDTFDKSYLMEYDHNKKEYRGTLLLKQGLYNYQYLAKQGNKYSTSLIEGNYYETPNQYSIYVYHRPTGSRYDQLIGFLLITYK